MYQPKTFVRNLLFKVYISKPSDYPHLPSKLLVMLSSGTGIHSINNQLQADKYASEGFLVVMPDQYVYLKLTKAALLTNPIQDLGGTQYPISRLILIR